MRKMQAAAVRQRTNPIMKRTSELANQNMESGSGMGRVAPYSRMEQGGMAHQYHMQIPPPPGFSQPLMTPQSMPRMVQYAQAVPPGYSGFPGSQGLPGTVVREAPHGARMSISPESHGFHSTMGVREAPRTMGMVGHGYETGFYNPSADPSQMSMQSRPRPTGGMKLRARAPAEERHATRMDVISPGELISPNSSAHKKGILSFVNDPGDFYLTISEEPYNNKLEEIQSGLTAFFADSSKRNEWGLRKIDKNAPCAAMFAQDGGWYRAMVTSAKTKEHGTIKAQFVDYGNEEKIYLKDVMFLPERFATMAPILAIRCSLKDAIPAGGGDIWSRDSRAFMEGLLEEELIVIFHGYDPVEGKFEVELINPSSDGAVPPDVLGALRKIHAAAPALGTKKVPAQYQVTSHTPVCAVGDDTLDSASALDTRRFYESTTVDVPGMQTPLDIPAEMGEYLDVIVSFVEPRSKTKQDGAPENQAVFVNMIQEVTKLERMGLTMNEECPECAPLKSSDITLGSLVAAKYSTDNCWYRAVVLTKYGSGYWEVFFVDFGNREMVCDGQDMVMLPRQFREYPPQAIRCTLKDVPHWVDREPLIRTPVTILLEGEGKNRKSFEVKMWYLDPKRGPLEAGSELMSIMNKPRSRGPGAGRK